MKLDNISCPFCEDTDFDLIGLKSHLLNYCDTFDDVPRPFSDEEKTWIFKEKNDENNG